MRELDDDDETEIYALAVPPYEWRVGQPCPLSGVIVEDFKEEKTSFNIVLEKTPGETRPAQTIVLRETALAITVT